MESPQKNVSIETIINFFQDAVRRGVPVSSSLYLDGAQKLSVLIAEVDDGLINAEMEYRELRAQFMAEGDSGVMAETRAKASNAYRRLLGLRAQRERIAWFIQIAKKRVELQSFDQ